MVLAGALASAAAMIHAGTRIYATIGPSRAALDGAGGLWLLSHGKLHHFGADGLRTEVADLAAIGAPARPSDFDMHRDGRAVLADPDTSELVRCKLPSGPCERLPARLKTLPAQPILPLNAAKVHVDDAGGRYYVSDNAGGQVVAMDFSGEVKARSRGAWLGHPNQLARTADDRVMVVNTDHGTIVTFNTSLDRVVETMATGGSGMTRPGRGLPFDSVGLPDGGIAVLIAARGMRDADLVKFQGGKAIWRADLGADSDPFDVELWRGKLWVSDATRYRIDAVGLDGSRAGTIEDAAFLAELDEAAKEPRRWKSIRIVAQLALVAFPLFGAILLWWLQPRQQARPVPSPPFRDAFGVRPALLRWLRIGSTIAAWGSLGLCVGTVAIVAHRYPLGLFETGHRLSALGFVVLVLFVGSVLFVAYRAIPAMYERLELAFDQDGVRYEAADAIWLFRRTERGAAPWSAVFADEARLLIGARLIAYKHPLMGRLLDAERMAALLAALPDGHLLSRTRLSARAWSAGAFRKPLLGVLAGLIVGMLVLALQRAFQSL